MVRATVRGKAVRIQEDTKAANVTGKEGSAHGQAEETEEYGEYGQVHSEEKSRRQKGREKSRWLKGRGSRWFEA